MRDTPVHIANERLKSLAGMFYNLATGLIAAVAARVYADGAITWPPALWTLGAIVLTFFASQLLWLLQHEDQA